MSDLGNKSPLLIAGGVGCVLLLCVGSMMLTGAVAGSFWISSPDEVAANDQVMTTDEDGQPDRPDDKRVPQTQAEPAVDSSGALTPWMSSLTFAAVLSGTDELKSGTSFDAGVTAIQATFEFNNLSSDHPWTQVWYNEGKEVLRTTQPWLESDVGAYEYPIETGGEPLAPGEWRLEIYVDGELLTSGRFAVADKAEPAGTSEKVDPTEIDEIYKLAYTKWDGEKHSLYVGDTAGSFEQYILRGAAGPSWSPDGRYLFFYGEEGIDQQRINGGLHPLPGVTNGIARMNASPLPARINQIRLFQGHGWNDGTARWANVSPDGTMIAYDGDRGGGRRIYFLGTNASQQFRYEIIGEQADWAPDSQRIVYRSGRNNQTGLWISNRTDSGHVRITTGGADSFPAWSPDGKTIAFSRDVGGNVDIYRVNIDGTELTRLTDAPGHDTLPAYLPNGDIIFRSARFGRWGIWKMRGDGSEQVEIISNAPVGPEWSFSRMGILH